MDESHFMLSQVGFCTFKVSSFSKYCRIIEIKNSIFSMGNSIMLFLPVTCKYVMVYYIDKALWSKNF